MLSDDPLARQSAVEEAVEAAVTMSGRSTAGRAGQRGGKREAGVTGRHYEIGRTNKAYCNAQL